MLISADGQRARKITHRSIHIDCQWMSFFPEKKRHLHIFCVYLIFRLWLYEGCVCQWTGYQRHFPVVKWRRQVWAAGVFTCQIHPLLVFNQCRLSIAKRIPRKDFVFSAPDTLWHIWYFLFSNMCLNNSKQTFVLDLCPDSDKGARMYTYGAEVDNKK